MPNLILPGCLSSPIPLLVSMEIQVHHLHTLNSNAGDEVKRKQKPQRKGGLVQHHQLWSSGSPALFFHPLLALGVGGLEGWGVHLVGHRWKQLADPRAQGCPRKRNRPTAYQVRAGAAQPSHKGRLPPPE